MTECSERGYHGCPIASIDKDYCEDCGAVLATYPPEPPPSLWRRFKTWCSNKWFELRNPDCPF